ncbi:mas-related G-protein coupled receptor MRG-like [Echinops telfairi]|uniref:Mas-related G-protein coupled receptor MRG-like n=1 Tax=Echinops telfairi TaxID=9371 RepID=A0ABM0J366_ECHTE|nr:mas-related G-protein coupled receptor MRG-like [Echinops telfairi]
MFLIMVGVSLCVMVGNGVVSGLLCLLPASSPSTTYMLNLVATNLLNLCCTTPILLEQVLERYHQVALGASELLEPISCFLDMAGLCLLAALSAEKALRSLCPAWFGRRCPRRASAAGLNICSDFKMHSGCQQFLKAFLACHLLLCLVMCVSGLVLGTRDLHGCRLCCPSRIYHMVRAVLTTVFLWSLPLVIVVVYLPWGEYLTLTFDLLLLLSALASTTHPLVYFLVGCLPTCGRREPLGVGLQKTLRSELEVEPKRALWT